MNTEHIITTFNRFAANEAHGNSPLYEYWSQQIVQNEELLQLIHHIPSSQPKPNLFFATIQYLALKSNHSIKHCFLHPEETDFETSFHLLKNFCKNFENDIIHLFKTKKVQTNEVQRAAYLYPLFHEIYEQAKKPLTLIEIGTSAGLLLNVDLYQYKIQQAEQVVHFGYEGSSLQINAANYGDPIVGVGPISIKNRLGIDLNIIDLTNDEDFYWLQCLIWPEQKLRKENLMKARDIHRICEKSLVEGDFRTVIPEYVSGLQDETQIVVFHTHVANQFPLVLKEELLSMLHQLSRQVPIYHIYNNMYDSYLHVDFVKSGKTHNLKLLMNIDGHGTYFHWAGTRVRKINEIF